MSTKRYNCWDNPDNRQTKVLEILSKRTGVDTTTVHKVLRAHHDYYMDEIERVLGNNNYGDVHENN